jgi:RNA polymerase sigma-70 factor (ECF subfamily)
MDQRPGTEPDLAARLAALHDASFGWARSCCRGDADLASDVLHSAYVKVLAGRAVFRARSGFRTWLFGVIRFTALEVLRAGARESPLDDVAEPASASPSPEAHLLETEQVIALRAALGRLPDRQREVVHLVFYEGLTVAEAAEVMAVSVGSARVHYARGKARLRTLLAPWRDHGEPREVVDVRPRAADARWSLAAEDGDSTT